MLKTVIIWESRSWRVGKTRPQHLWYELQGSGCMTLLSSILWFPKSLQSCSQGPAELSLALPPNQPSCPEWGISYHHKGLLNHEAAIIPGKVSTSEYSQDTSHHPLGPSNHQGMKNSFWEATSTRPPVDYFVHYVVIYYMIYMFIYIHGGSANIWIQNKLPE